METKVQNSAVKEHIEINGVVLSPEALETIKHLQADNNHSINQYSNSIANLVCYMQKLFTHELDSDPDLVKEGMNHLSELIDVRETIKLIAKP